MDLEDAGTRAKFVLHGRDASFTQAFDALFQAAGIRVIRSAVQAPRMNSITERWIGSCRRELLDRTLIWNQHHLMMALREYEDFYNSHRPHRYNSHRPHRALGQAAPLRPLPDGVADLHHVRVRGMTAWVASSTNIAWWHGFSSHKFTALRHFALDGTDHARHKEQASMIRGTSSGATTTSTTNDFAVSSTGHT